VNLYGFVGNDGVDRWDIRGASYASSFRRAELNIPSVFLGQTATFGGVNSFWIKVQGDGAFDAASGSWKFNGMPYSISGFSTRSTWSSTITHTSGVTIWTDRSGTCPRECAFYEVHRRFSNNLVSVGSLVSFGPSTIDWQEKLWVEVCADGTARKGQYTEELTALWGGSQLRVSYQ